MKVKDFMTRDMTAVSEDTLLKDVARIMARHQLSGLPVVDKEQRVIGFISERDLIESAFPGRFSQDDLFLAANFAQLAQQLSKVGEESRARDFMTTTPECVTEETDEAALAELLIRHKHKIVPVVREEKLVGIVSRADLVRALIEEAGG